LDELSARRKAVDINYYDKIRPLFSLCIDASEKYSDINAGCMKTLYSLTIRGKGPNMG
jgi:hypothetical protein